MITISNAAITKSQGHWYCHPSANTSSCTNSSYVGCHGQNVSCEAYSCTPQSPGCSCMVGSYNCSSDCSYEASPELCSCNADTCSCLSGVYSTACVSCAVFIHRHPHNSFNSFLLDMLNTPDSMQEVSGNEFLKDGCYSIYVIQSLLKSNDFSFIFLNLFFFFLL